MIKITKKKVFRSSRGDDDMAYVLNKHSGDLEEPPVFSTGDSRYEDYIQLPNALYVDKTKFIRSWWEKGDKVTLLVRPRRFSKTMLMSTVHRWFDCKTNDERIYYFSDTDVWENASEDLLESASHYEPILITFKDVDGTSFRELFRGLRKAIRDSLYYSKAFKMYEKECIDYVGYPLPSSFNGQESVLDLMDFFTGSLYYMYNLHKKKFIVLIDEYDKILMDAASVGGAYYDGVSKMYRGFLNEIFKDKPFLERGILTGVLPLAANSILSAFNNSVQDSFFDSTYKDIFGFTWDEVKKLTSWMTEDQRRRMLDSLDGYSSGDITVYNPWSVVNYIRDVSHNNPINNYWVHTANTDWIEYRKELSEEEFLQVSSLIEGGEINILISRDLDYLHRNQTLSNFLNYAFYTGYLTFTHRELDSAAYIIPNREVRDAWIINIQNIIPDLEMGIDWGTVLSELEQDEANEFYLSNILQEFLEKHASSYDLTNEVAYHMLILGMLDSISKTHRFSSNRESGNGRYDIGVTPMSGGGRRLRNYVFEFKKAPSVKALDRSCDDAMEQIKDRKYHQAFDNQYDLVGIGIAGYKKNVKVKIEILPASVIYQRPGKSGHMDKFS